MGRNPESKPLSLPTLAVEGQPQVVLQWNAMECNGMQWNAVECSGMQWNGMEWNGME